MKKTLLLLSMLMSSFTCLFAQGGDTLLFENFNDTLDLVDNYPNLTTGSNTSWVNSDIDLMPDMSGSGFPSYWFASYSDATDTNNIVARSSSWTNTSSIQVQNFLISPPIQIIDNSAMLYWRSAPLQTPRYADGMTVLVAKGSNLESNFTDTLKQYAEFISASPDTAFNQSYSNYTFGNGYIHGASLADSIYLALPSNGDSSRYRGLLRPDSASLAAFVGETIYIAFVGDSHDDFYYILDDVMVIGTAANAVKELANNNFNMVLAPNPATQVSRVSFKVEHFSRIIISIMDAEGKLVKRFDRGQMMTGNHFVDLDLSNIPQGNYFVQINSNYKTEASRLSVIK